MLHGKLTGLMLLTAVVFIGSLAQATSRGADPGFTTEWVVSPATGMDAILLIGAASGDVMQAQIYPDDIQWVKDHFSSDGLAALEKMDSTLRVRLGLLTGPVLAYFFSAGPVESLEQVIESAADPVGRLKPGLMKTPHWDPQEFESAVQLMPFVHTALVELRDAGFDEWYSNRHHANLLAAVQTNLEAVQPYDIIPEQQRLLGRPLEPRVEILIVNYAKPYGIRISGQRFVAYYGWDGQIQLHVAAHEIFHSPFKRDDQELAERLGELRTDPWLTNIVENHDPQFGYNSFEGVVDEGSTQALDQIVTERLGFGKEPGKRWRESDGGMHLLAAAIYHAMKESGFADRGGSYSDWFKSALQNGLLSPGAVKQRAAAVVGQEAVDAWNPG